MYNINGLNTIKGQYLNADASLTYTRIYHNATLSHRIL